MTSNMKEQALEAAIEKTLTGSYTEEHQELAGSSVCEPQATYRSGHGFYRGNPSDFNKRFAVDETRLLHFLETTQAKELDKLKRRSDWKIALLTRLDKKIAQKGIIYLLKKGIGIDDAQFTLFYQYPSSPDSQTAKKLFEQNEFSVTRQLHYSEADPAQSIDMVIFLNGLPLITLELKNEWTGQCARIDAQRQYRERDCKQPLLRFARCLVHFAVDTDEVYMTTRLDGRNTVFLPFNKGNNCGKGNPVNPDGHRTEYLWKEIFSRYRLANILQHFVRLGGEEKKSLGEHTLFFPRYHQLQVVCRLMDDVAQRGVGHNYLIQHSAGSGKSNSITWAAYTLIEAYGKSETQSETSTIRKPLFDSVIVVTDRRLLDKQLRDNLKDFAENNGILAPALKSSQLKQFLEEGKRIIVTTVQKFPFVVDEIAELNDKRFAVIIDEAHSSQSGTAADDMNRVIGNQQAEDEEDVQDQIVAAMKSRKMHGNASFFAFTATPKRITLEKFGQLQPDGSFRPYDLYSMKQAIEEGFILDVLANYSTYKSYYEIQKSIDDNPLFQTDQAQKKLKSHVERDPKTIEQKAEMILNHFMEHVFKPKKLQGKAKAMVVTRDIESAIHYYQSLSRLLAQKGSPFEILIAFSGEKTVDGIKYTEVSMNGFPEKETPDAFDSPRFRILVVANKYLTGFDQPKLIGMYIDKKLQDVQAVQTLSRINRSSNKLGKKTEDLFIIDFFNSTEDIKEAFDPYYTATSLEKATDVNILHDLQEFLDDSGVYETHEIEAFVKGYFANLEAQELSPYIDAAAERFNHTLEWNDEQKADFKIKAKQFVKVYGQMASLMPFEIIAWEKLFWFLKFLITKLHVKNTQTDGLDELLNAVDLSTYAISRDRLNEKIELNAESSVLTQTGTNPHGVHNAEQEDDLDTIIRTFNDHYFSKWDTMPETKRITLIRLANSIKKHRDFQPKLIDIHDPEKQKLAFDQIFEDVISENRRNEMDLYRLIAQDDDFRNGLKQALSRLINFRK